MKMFFFSFRFTCVSIQQFVRTELIGNNYAIIEKISDETFKGMREL